MPDHLTDLLRLVEAYAKATDLAEATVSTRALQDGKRVASLRAGRDIGVRRLNEAVQWFSDHWPENAEWPADVARPAPIATTAA